MDRGRGTEHQPVQNANNGIYPKKKVRGTRTSKTSGDRNTAGEGSQVPRCNTRYKTNIELTTAKGQGKTWGLSPKMMYWTYNMLVKPMMTYASMVWWTKMRQPTAVNELRRVQRLACLSITGAMRTTATAAMEVLLNLPPIETVMMGEARMGFYRLQNDENQAWLGHSNIRKLHLFHL